MDLRDQLKNIFPDHVESDYQEPEAEFRQVGELICKYEKKGRNGRPVTLVEGFEGTDETLKDLAKKIKTKLAIGGSLKDGVIIFQGDNREKIIELLRAEGYKTKRVGG